MRHILLVGNPNCGKTTLFNALTGDNQRIGNWPGVTVEQKTGQFSLNDQLITVTDLPGIYSLGAHAQGLSQDEQIATEVVSTSAADCIVNLVDACHLERHLYLTTQLLELGKPVIVVVNMMDIAQQRGIAVDMNVLSQRLACPVISMQAHKKKGLASLHQALLNPPQNSSVWALSGSSALHQALEYLEQQLLLQGYTQPSAYYMARRLAEGDELPVHIAWAGRQDPGLDLLIADARYQQIHELVALAQTKQSDASEHFTAKLDKIVLNRFLALPLFFIVMYLMFLFAINLGGAFQDFFDLSSETLFVQGSASLLTQLQAPNWLIALIANGIGRGINTTLTFIPVIAAMFFFLSLLETSGYMARAAFVVDRIMRAMGLPGKSFVPMIVGFGCNVPAIMAARTLDSESDRLLTVMMSPFMSCSARLAIYAVFVAAFFPAGGQNVVFSLYLIGILMAVFTGFILRKTYLKGQAAPLILELPAYHKPALGRLLRETGVRLRFFVQRAGILIIPICVILGGLNAITIDGGIHSGEASTQSVLSLIGQWITPLFAPMGIHQDNWPATVGLLTGTLAKEVVIGTLNSLYVQVGQVNEVTAIPLDFWQGMQAALWSIPHNLAQLGSSFGWSSAGDGANSALSANAYGIMAQRFDGPIGAYAYLLFVLLYIPCVSTMAVIRQEANKQLMWASIIWSFLLAYTVAVVFYQGATFMAHPGQSIFWIGLVLSSLLLVLVFFIYGTLAMRGRYAAVTS